MNNDNNPFAKPSAQPTANYGATHTSTTTTHPTVPQVTNTNRGRGMGDKIRGAYEVIHGFGENIRGTFLGALDTMVSRNSSLQTRNDQIAAEGRAELQRGLTRLGRRGAGAGTTSHTTPSATHTEPLYSEHAQGAISNYPDTHTTAGAGGFKRPERAYDQNVAGAPPPLPTRHHNPEFEGIQSYPEGKSKGL